MMKFLSAKSKQGFTLVEMLIYLNLLSILLLFISRIFLTTLDVQVRSQSSSAVQIDDQFILSRLQYDLYRADSVVTPANIGDIASSLVLQIDGEMYGYSVIDGQLQLTSGLDTFQINSIRTSISSFEVEKMGNIGGLPTVRASYQIQSEFDLNQNPESRTSSAVFGTR